MFQFRRLCVSIWFLLFYLLADAIANCPFSQYVCQSDSITHSQYSVHKQLYCTARFAMFTSRLCKYLYQPNNILSRVLMFYVYVCQFIILRTPITHISSHYAR
ncbi:hypothetical protein V1520DRAFT_339403 [Lipomyces starkeyi]|uniref:Secreted protein n=1 Tax=Lipomyces starkeyi NRRL Y-11557 TaxID=675824 RepID=A0A1E3PXN5_LIPST|nr:hypothetical protein LIPSTDRAFT_176213 [Lipomyces starkeyi NRRL Y-11557]